MGACAFSSMDTIDHKENNRGRSKFNFDELSKDRYIVDHINDKRISYIDDVNQIIYYMPDNETHKEPDKKVINIIDQILPTVRSVIMKSDDDNACDIIKLQHISKQEKLWMPMIFRLINKIEINDPLGSSVISIFLEEMPLVTKEQIYMLSEKMLLDSKIYSEKIQRNILVILSCLSEKMAGTYVATCIYEKSIQFIENCLNNGIKFKENVEFHSKDYDKLQVLICALITLERFSLSSQNRLAIMNLFLTNGNPLIRLSEWKEEENSLMRQIGFLSQYLLDNTFMFEDHVYDYLKLTKSNIRAILNDEDTSENLKISANGLEARNDTLSFESVRSTCQVDEGAWFYEVTLLTNGIMQLGFASKSSYFLNHQGCGIGDDQFSVGYDGCRNLIWYNALHHNVKHQQTWKQGDVIGFLLDINRKVIVFYVNGVALNQVHTDIFSKVQKGFFPAASFMSFQQVKFNFGAEAFKYPPYQKFKNFNEHAQINSSKRYVLPKRVKLDILKQHVTKEDSCTLCCENKANIILLPCKHDVFCDVCVKRLSNICPICRMKYSKFINKFK